MPLSRRQFLAGSLMAAAAVALPRNGFAAEPGGKRTFKIALQLYSVRGDCGKDFDAVLEKVARMGFEGVEFAGYHKYGGKGAELRKKLDDLGLVAAGTHIGTGSFRGDNLQKTIDFHQTIGCKYLCVPGDGDFTHPEKSKALAEFMTQVAAKLKPLGMYIGYHNHEAEFRKKDGDKNYWDLFAERTSADVVLQQDCGWTTAAGFNPAEYVKKYPGRSKIVHFKPTVVKGEEKDGKKAIFGEDSVDWKSVIEACNTVGGTEWTTIEQERYPDGKSPMECSELSLQGMKKLLASMGL